MKPEILKASWFKAALLFWLAFAPLAQAFYNPSTGKWLSRDPIGELGGLNQHGFVSADPVNRLDGLGLAVQPVSIPPWPPPIPPSVPYWPPPPPPPPEPYPEGFAMCSRGVAVDGASDVAGKCCNSFGGEHTYLQYVSTPPRPEEGPPFVWGWGFSGGTTAAGENHFDATSCKRCTKNGSSLKFGSGSGKPGSSATDDEIRDCIMNRKPSRRYTFPFYVCTDWAKEAAKDCGLKCK